MTILSGKTKCLRCTHDIANEDIAGDYCIDCLMAMDRQKSKEIDVMLKAEECVRCFGNCKLSDLPVELECFPCSGIKRQRKLLEQEE